MNFRTFSNIDTPYFVHLSGTFYANQQYKIFSNFFTEDKDYSNFFTIGYLFVEIGNNKFF